MSTPANKLELRHNGSPVVRWTIISVALLFLFVFLFLPLASIFGEAFAKGWQTYVASIRDPEALSAIRLTLVACGIAVALNMVFGVAAAWAVSRFSFRGKTLLISLIDLPLAVSPVVAGFIFVLLFGLHGWFGSWLDTHNIQVLFGVPAVIIATVFVTFPFVARELIPFMQAQGSDEEQAALVLGASSWRTFCSITLPNIRWSLLYGVILCSARAMGEFGAVSIVSGHIRGETITLPLQVEILYNEYNFAAAFSVASLLSVIAVITLLIKKVIEGRAGIRGGHA